jgi:C4-dicarboxylate-specific signal transduction histidine kinase
MRASNRQDARDDTTTELPRFNPLNRVVALLRHDARQPLTTIRMNLVAAKRMLAEERANPRVAAALEAIADSLAAQQDLDRFISAMRPRQLRSMVFGSLALNDVALAAERALRLVAASRSRQIELRLAEHSPTVKGDGARLRSALQSLLWRTLSANADGAHDPLVLATRESSSFAELSASGLPRALLLGPDRTHNLAFTHSVARVHGGVVRIDSHGTAATVRIVIPACSGQLPANTNEARP